MLGERRVRALRDLGAQTGKAKTTEEAFALAAQTLSEYELDVPFAMFYLIDSARKEARLDRPIGTIARYLCDSDDRSEIAAIFNLAIGRGGELQSALAGGRSGNAARLVRSISGRSKDGPGVADHAAG